MKQLAKISLWEYHLIINAYLIDYTYSNTEKGFVITTMTRIVIPTGHATQIHNIKYLFRRLSQKAGK